MNLHKFGQRDINNAATYHIFLFYLFTCLLVVYFHLSSACYCRVFVTLEINVGIFSTGPLI